MMEQVLSELIGVSHMVRSPGITASEVRGRGGMRRSVSSLNGSPVSSAWLQIYCADRKDGA